MSAQELRDEALNSVESGSTDEEWNSCLGAVLRVAKTEMEFTTDDVMAVLPSLPREPRLLGAVMRRAVINGWVERTERMAPSHRRESHAREKRVWRSLIAGAA